MHDVNLALCRWTRALNPRVVGALHVTCADEAEWECADSFQRWFVNDLLPSSKVSQRAAFRLATLGGRYERGALAVAEQHFANAAVARYGKMNRYGAESTACSALHTVLAGDEQPFVREPCETFATGGRGRLAALCDPARVDPAFRSLFVALTSARWQAQRVEQDIEEHTPASPTLYLVASCVTLNRPGPDTELLCGLYTGDRRADAPTVEYVGLGDDPGRYQPQYEASRLRITDEQRPG